MSEHYLAFNGQVVEKPGKGEHSDPEPDRSEYSRSTFKSMMQQIREAYDAGLKAGRLDSVVFESLVEDRIYNPKRYPLKHVVNALVRVSSKAQWMNRKYFGGRYR